MNAILDYSSMSKFTGISRTHLVNIFTGISKPTSTVMFKIQDYLEQKKGLVINVRFLYAHPDGLAPEKVCEKYYYLKKAEEVGV